MEKQQAACAAAVVLRATAKPSYSRLCGQLAAPGQAGMLSRLPHQRSDLSVVGDGRASRCMRQDRLQVRGGDAIAGRGMKPSEIS